ncbi:TPA: DUF551 domain-containing protein [Kluyvera intermedia]|uniref:DUF551 domain-containing protein n=2 Tax=Enterobacteriaceae TaxID=543 RepID=A0AAC8QQT3_9ENTR|nr:DUF551 domain-containing protein [Phytobacter ursingii]HAT2207437.1 DUF551 domain-containing protein [Kluyvera intermedia]AKL13306.1 hypothetical protein AB182_19315 [Phytobacter ursingii]HAT2518099.1 DUF551 domain-containing protein [Kluyvera intermedia]HAT2606225.1 DUF551 domain-containing protein [Kluyvera intermedia]HAT2683013.1 DUF551 domain-containing protein [Kluyvera intermedia]
MKDETLLSDEQAAFEKFMEEKFRDLIDRRHVKNGDGGYFAWDMVVAWIVWQGRAAIQSGNSGHVPAGYVLVSAEFIDTVNQAFKEVGDRKSFPGHSHDIPGVWDSDNGEKANKPCAQCAMWSKLHDMLAAAPVASDGWIPVSERMPEFNDEVLAWHRHGYSLIAVYSTSKDPITYKTYRCLVDNKGHEIDATHWQPLPDAPKVTP